MNWTGGGAPISEEGTCEFETKWDTSGTKPVTASIDGCTSNRQKDITVIKVTSLTPNEGTEFDDGDGNSNTKSYVVCIVPTGTNPGIVTVTATPSPTVAEADLP